MVTIMTDVTELTLPSWRRRGIVNQRGPVVHPSHAYGEAALALGLARGASAASVRTPSAMVDGHRRGSAVGVTKGAVS
jgi:hypothetical protein